MLVVTGWRASQHMEYWWILFAYMSWIITIKNQQFHMQVIFCQNITWIGFFLVIFRGFTAGLSWDVPNQHLKRSTWSKSFRSFFVPDTVDIKISQGQPPENIRKTLWNPWGYSPGLKGWEKNGFRTNHQQISVDPISCRLLGCFLPKCVAGLKGFYREKDTMFLADSFNGLQVGCGHENGYLLGCPRKLGSMVSKWVISPTYKWDIPWGYNPLILTFY